MILLHADKVVSDAYDVIEDGEPPQGNALASNALKPKSRSLTPELLWWIVRDNNTLHTEPRAARLLESMMFAAAR